MSEVCKESTPVRGWGAEASPMDGDASSSRLVELSGTAVERAARLGECLRRDRAPVFRALLELPLIPARIPPGLRRGLLHVALRALGAAYLRSHRSVLDSGPMPWRRMLEEMAAAAGLSPAVLYGLHALEIESANFGYQLGCTSLLLGPSQTAPARPLLAYNHDFPPAFGGLLRVRRSRPRDGRASIGLGYVPMLGAVAGVNECGLALSMNHAYATDIRRRRPSLLNTLLVQECLEQCDDVDQALARIARSRPSNGSILSLIDRRGARAVVELSATRSVVRRPSDQELDWSFNRYRDAGMAAVEVPIGARSVGLLGGVDVHAHNLGRQRRFDELQAAARSDAARGGRDPRPHYEDSDVLALLSDHDGGEGSSLTLCRHGDPLSETLASVLIEPRGPSMRVAFGPPCRTEFTTIDLEVASAPPSAPAPVRSLPGPAPIEIRPLRLPQDAARLIDAWFEIHRDEPHWVPPLISERRRFLDPRRNPYFRGAQVQCFLALRGGRPVGTISAQVDEAVQRSEPGVGFFGFFEFVDEVEVAGALLEAARRWLGERGMHEARGPYSLGPHHEFGLLLSGFDRDPCILNPHSPPHAAAIYEALGLRKIKEWYAYWLDAGPVPPFLERVTRRLRTAQPEIEVRPLDRARFEEDVEDFWEIYNDAWEGNWGHARIEKDEFRWMARGLRDLIDPRLTWFASIRGEPVAAAISLPDVNPILRRMRGRLLPLGWWHWLRGRRRVDVLRSFLLGVKKQYQHLPLGALLYQRTWEEGLSRGLRGAEASLVVEDNRRMRGALEKMGARIDKVYGTFSCRTSPAFSYGAVEESRA